VGLLVGELVGGEFVGWPEPDSVLAGTGIWRNPEDSGGIGTKYRNSCPTGIPAKNYCDIGKKQEFLRPPPKPRSCEKFLRKTQEKKEILRNPVFFCF
jgi:hypothetical protein